MSANPYSSPLAPLGDSAFDRGPARCGRASLTVGAVVLLMFLMQGGATVNTSGPLSGVHIFLMLSWMPLTIFNACGICLGGVGLVQRNCGRCQAILGLVFNAMPIAFVVYWSWQRR